MDKVLDSALLSSANKRKGILAIGAHPDDIELGCGASLARLAQKGIYIATGIFYGESCRQYFRQRRRNGRCSDSNCQNRRKS